MHSAIVSNSTQASIPAAIFEDERPVHRAPSRESEATLTAASNPTSSAISTPTEGEFDARRRDSNRVASTFSQADGHAVVQAELMRHLRAKGLLTHAEAKSMLFAAMEMMPPDLLADAQDAIEGLAARFER